MAPSSDLIFLFFLLIFSLQVCISIDYIKFCVLLENVQLEVVSLYYYPWIKQTDFNKLKFQTHIAERLLQAGQ